MDTKKIIQMADKTMRLVGKGAPLKQILDAHDLVLAVWPDEGAFDGVSTLIVKGHRRLEALASELQKDMDGATRMQRGGVAMRTTAIHVSDWNTAVTIRETIGDVLGHRRSR